MEQKAALAVAAGVLEAEAGAIMKLARQLGEAFIKAVDLAAACSGKIAVTGLGKSGIVCKKIAATLSSTGSPAMFLHASDALHGDSGILTRNDLILAVSKSGETAEIVKVLDISKRLGLPVIAMTGEQNSTLARHADVFLDVGAGDEACPFGLVPTTSTAAAMAMGDALAIALMERRGFRKEDFAILHPAGSLGKKLLQVVDLMHRGDAMPRVLNDTRMADVICEMSRKGLGMAVVTDAAGALSGVISDGDLRRLLQKSANPLECTAGEVMSRAPKTIREKELATAALSIMEEMKITSLVVIDQEGMTTGVIHLHDLWRTELF
ncbi:MAG TPA: KpsF/GutQ family sugar-phosphate isomerase [Acidobacteriota bacterium]|nr:KpsF/GutQ family sugar-phosphate isomerase [Acidobacteriota bacterium]